MNRLKALWRVLISREFFVMTTHQIIESDYDHHELEYKCIKNTHREGFKYYLYRWLHDHEASFYDDM